MKTFINLLLTIEIVLLCTAAQAFPVRDEGTAKENVPVIVTGFKLNNGCERTNSREVTLNHTIENGVPTMYSVSEDPELVGRAWLPYSSLPVYRLSEGVGLKNVYFMVADHENKSEVVSAKIYFDESVTVEMHGLTAKAYPNPAENSVNIIVDGNVSPVTVSVYSVGGALYLSQIYNTPAFMLDLSRCPAGTLLIHLSNGQRYVVKRIIKL